MKVECYGGYGHASNCYLVTDDGETEAIIIDPSVSFTPLSRSRGRLLPKITGILLTHAHYDHMLAVDEWREKTGAPLLIHAADAPALSDGIRNVWRMFTGADGGTGPAERLLTEGDIIRCGKEELRVLSTPGHTPGSICLACGADDLITGDTLFDGGYGRYDLWGGSLDALVDSMKRLTALPEHLTIYPGHGGSATLGSALRMTGLVD
jgi:glyoxylase-like metal-dependent hydrolase (beta-lactamase superfamily II)